MSRFEISKRLIAINSASSLIRSAIQLTVIVGIQAYLVKNIRADEYEVLVLVFPLGMYVPMITLTVGGGISRFVIEAYAKGDMRRVTQIASTMWPLCLLAASLVATLGAVLAQNIQAALDLNPAYVRDAQIMFAIVVVKATSRTCILPFTVGIEVKQKFAFMNIFGLGLEVLRVLIVLTLLFGVSTRALWMVVATIPLFVLDDIVSFTYSRRLVPELRFKASEFRRELIKPILKFGGNILASRLAGILREVSGPMFLAHHSNSIQVTSYRLGSYVDTKFYPTVLGPMLTLQPALTGMNAIGQQDRLRRTFLRMSRLLLWAFLFFGVPASIFHDEIWSVWLGQRSRAVAPGAIVMILLFAKALFVFPQPVIAQIALAKARNGPLALRVWVIELSTVALAFYLVTQRNMGAIGLATATLAVTAVGNPLLLWPFGLRMTETRFVDFLRETIIPGLLPALVAAPVWLLAWYKMPTRRHLEPLHLRTPGLCGVRHRALPLLPATRGTSRPGQGLEGTPRPKQATESGRVGPRPILPVRVLPTRLQPRAPTR